jgi:transposase
MARPLSLDLRSRVAAALTEGATVREAAARFAISVASAVRIGQLARAGRGLEAKKPGGPPPLMLLSAADEITTRLASKADWTERALAADLRAAGIAMSHDTVWRFMRRQGLSFKKRCWPARRTELTWPAGEHAGGRISIGLIPHAWCSWMKPGPRPT